MRAVVQRVKKAGVKVGERTIGQIGLGFLVLLGIKADDSEKEVQALAKKILELRIMADKADQMNKSILEKKGELLVVPQFTLYADTKKGRRPNFIQAAKPEKAKKLFQKFLQKLEKSGLRVEKGEFGARMKVSLINDGPVTIILNQERKDG